MAKSRIPDEIKYFILSNNQKQYKEEQRKRRLFNRYYHKSLFYISSLVVRLLYVLIFVIVFFMYDTSKGFRNERFEDCYRELHYSSRTSKSIIYIKTNYDTYFTSKNFHDYSRFTPGDIIKVEHNIFGKPIYFTKDGWNIKYGIYKNYIYYVMVLFATFLTFFFNDGLDFFSHKLLYLFYVIDLLSLILFFIT